MTSMTNTPGRCSQRRPLSPTSSSVQQQQQQELLKLIAQHFHNQLTSTPAAAVSATGEGQNPSQQQQSYLPVQSSTRPQVSNSLQAAQTSNSLSADFIDSQTSTGSNLLYCSPLLANIQHGQHRLINNQQQQQPFSCVSPLNFTADTQQQATNQFSNAQSQQPVASIFGADASLLDFHQQQQRFVLSLQQQYLIQAASAAAARQQFEQHCPDAYVPLIPTTKQGPATSQQTDAAGSTNMQTASRRRPEQRRNKSELLKFSISTILGSSPVSHIHELQHQSERKSSHGRGSIRAHQQQQLRRLANDDNDNDEMDEDEDDDDDNNVNGSDGDHVDLVLSRSQSPTVISSPALRDERARHAPDENMIEHGSVENSSESASASAMNHVVTNYLEHAVARSMAAAAAAAAYKPDMSRQGSSSQGKIISDMHHHHHHHPHHEQQQQQQQQQQRNSQFNTQLGPNAYTAQATGALNTQPGAFPWTVATRGKPRRGMMRRAVFSDGQRIGLEKRFQLQKYISKPDRKKLAEKLGLRDSQVKIWFQNRRMKWRNSKERELLSAGGSREQTLPTRNNPNPDLSDVGETIKRIQQVSTGVTTIADDDQNDTLTLVGNK